MSPPLNKRLRNRISKRDRELHEEMAGLGLSDFETVQQCNERQEQMIARLRQAEYEAGDRRDLRQCEPDWCACEHCVDGCWQATRNRRYGEITSGYKILKRHTGNLFEVCVVHPLWQRDVGHLQDISINAARQWLERRLRNLGPDVTAIGSFEVSLNRELDGSEHWAGHMHLIVAHDDERALKKALRLEKRHRSDANDVPVKVRLVTNVGRQLGYALKRLVEERRAYRGKRNGRQQRRSLPPAPDHWAEHDAWLLSISKGARTIAIGCTRTGSKLHLRRRSAVDATRNRRKRIWSL
jgi:hypothetical protein